jgi:hypothetical protein
MGRYHRVCLTNACKGLYYLVTSCSHSAAWYDRGLVFVTSCSLLLSMIHESLQTKKEGLESQERGGNLGFS